MENHELLTSENEKTNWKRKKNKLEKKEIVIKYKKVKGEKHINHVGKEVSERVTGPDCK